MGKYGLAVPLAALLCGVPSAAAAAQAANAVGQQEPTPPLTSAGTTQDKPRAGNPLWAIALTDLTETHARPLFSASRRPPAPPVLASLA